MAHELEVQTCDITPPRRGAVLAITTDTTSRPYDLTLLTMGGVPYSGTVSQHIFLTIQAETADVYYFFHSATDSSMSKTAALAAGGSAAYANTHCAYLQAGQSVTHRIHLSVDKWIEVQGSGSGICRLFASSSPSNVPV